MPYIGHLFYGFCILIPILYFTKNDNSFNYKVAFIFFANCLWGPDIVIMLPFWQIHSLIGFALFAIPLSLFYSYFSRFSLIKSEKKFFPLKFEDDGIRVVNWKNAYLITVAGGFSHLLIDTLFYLPITMSLWPGVGITQTELITFWGMDAMEVNEFYTIGSAILVSIILLSLFCFKKGYKETSQLFLIAIGLTGGIVIFSQAFIGSRKELGVLLFCVIYFLIPLFFLLYAAREVQDNPIESSSEQEPNKKPRFNFVVLLSILMALYLVLYAFIVITTAESIAAQYFGMFGGNITEMRKSIVIIGYINLILSLALLIGLIGLFFKSNICRYVVIAISCYYFTIVFPLAIALFLCQKDVKVLFRKKNQ